MKAYRAKGDKLVMFRPEMNMRRMNLSAGRMCMPEIDVDFMVDAIAQLVKLEKDWIPSSEGTSLYIRPFMMATEAFLGVHPASDYLLLVILSPVGPYYPEGLKPVRIYVEEEHVRAVKGGTGFTKCAGNYAASLIGQVEAEKQGYAQVLWLDGKEQKYVDEVGAMNVFFKVDGKVITPELSGAILPGITRDSVITLLKDWGVPVEERKVSMQELADAYKAGKLEEAFGTGTAAVISPIGELRWGDTVMNINNNEIGPLSQRLYNQLTGIQRGTAEDTFNWVYEIQ
jgi:branched-chain amino acid aminotransferase